MLFTFIFLQLFRNKVSCKGKMKRPGGRNGSGDGGGDGGHRVTPNFQVAGNAAT